MGATRQVMRMVLAFAMLASAGCASRPRPATDPPAGLPPLDLSRENFDSRSAGPSAILDPPAGAVQPPSAGAEQPPSPPPEWPTEPQAVNFAAPPPVQNRPAQAEVYTPVLIPKLAIGIEGGRTVSPGDMVPLEVSVANTGTGPATNVNVRATLDAALSHESGVPVLEVAVGTLAAGQSRTVPLSLRAMQPGKPAVHVLASGDGELHAEAARSILVAQRALQLTLSGAPTRYVNRPGPWEVRVANIGDAGLSNVTARVRLPRELRFQSATGNGKLEAGEVVWTIGDLRPGERRELQVTAIPVAGAGQATLTGIAAADQVPAQTADVAFEVMGMPVLRTDVLAPPVGVPAGGKGVVTVRVTNQGTLAARNVTVVAVAPQPFLTPRFGTGPTVGRVQGERVEFAPVTRIEPEQTVTFQIEVAGGQSGDGRMRVEVRSESTPTPLVVEEAIRVVPPPVPGRVPAAP
jgi:uncharacterized repeat protein (TIGR01451 family)